MQDAQAGVKLMRRLAGRFAKASFTLNITTLAQTGCVGARYIADIRDATVGLPVLLIAMHCCTGAPDTRRGGDLLRSQPKARVSGPAGPAPATTIAPANQWPRPSGCVAGRGPTRPRRHPSKA
jgi:hypothetical protein